MSEKRKQDTVRIQARVTLNAGGVVTEVEASVPPVIGFGYIREPRAGQLERLIRDTTRAAKKAWWNSPTNSGEEITVTMSRTVPAAKER